MCNTLFVLGNTARKILKDSTDIVAQSLPIGKVVESYKAIRGSSKDAVIKAVQFTNSTILVCSKNILFVTTKSIIDESKIIKDLFSFFQCQQRTS